MSPVLSFEQFKAVVQSCTFGWPFRVWAFAVDADRDVCGNYRIRFTAKVPDRDFGKHGPLRCDSVHDPRVFRTDEDVARAVHKLAMTCVVHELDESFQFANVRIYDPHNELKRRGP